MRCTLDVMSFYPLENCVDLLKDPELNSLVLQLRLNCSESVCRHSDYDEYMVIMKRDQNKACHPNCTCIAKRKHNDERASEET